MAVRERAATAGGRRPAFGFHFNCAGRGAALFGEPDQRRNHFHTYTGALVVFPG